MAGTITASLLTRLNNKVEDEDSDNPIWTDSLKYSYMSDAQREIANMLDNAYLTEFQEIAASQDVSAALALSALDANGVLKGAAGITDVHVTADSTTKWATIIDQTERKFYEESNGFNKYSDNRPVCYVFKGNLYTLVDTTSGATADVYFLKKPDDISATVDPVLNSSLYGILLNWTAMKLFDSNDDARAAREQKKAIDQITVLNERVK